MSQRVSGHFAKTIASSKGSHARIACLSLDDGRKGNEGGDTIASLANEMSRAA